VVLKEPLLFADVDGSADLQHLVDRGLREAAFRIRPSDFEGFSVLLERAGFDSLPPADEAPVGLVDWEQAGFDLDPETSSIVEHAMRGRWERERPIALGSPLVLAAFAHHAEDATPPEDVTPGLVRSRLRVALGAVIDRGLHGGDSAGKAGEMMSQPVTLELDETFDRAEEIAFRTTSREQICPRHLLAALLTYEAFPDTSSVARLLEEFLVSREDMIAELRKLTVEGASSEDPPFPSDDPDAWAEVLREGRLDERPVLVAYAPDAAAERDLLGIAGDVNSLASLISAKSVVPPLSIGLFGDWGSGKTFFMRQLQQRVDEITQDARASGEPQRKIAFHKRIVQIEFNAWHYVESNLWASLVEHIFDNLRVSRDDETDLVKKRRKHWLEQLGVEQRNLEGARQAKEQAESELGDAVDDLEVARGEHETEVTKLAAAVAEHRDPIALVTLQQELREEIQGTLKNAGVDKAVESARELSSALDDSLTTMRRGWALFAPLFHADDAKKRTRQLYLILGLIAVVALVPGLILSWLDQDVMAVLTSATGAITTALTGGASWLKRQTGWVNDWIARAEQNRRSIDELVAAKTKESARKVAAIEKTVELRLRKYEAVVQREQAIRQRIHEIEEELARTTPTRLLAQFIEERADSEDYRKHLGLLALIREDFEKLSNLVQLHNEALEDGTEAGGDEYEDMMFNRIVLYIDDLDRCPEDRVLQVLQAIHLLLAFPLFVVVVGVDARWVSRALLRGYRGLLHWRDEGRNGRAERELGRLASPQDYLEKIFQIPLWLRPINEAGRSSLIHGLLASSVVAPPAEVKGEGSSEDEDRDRDDENGDEGGGGTPAMNEMLPIPLTAEEESALGLLGELVAEPESRKRAAALFLQLRGLAEHPELGLFLSAVVAGMPGIRRPFLWTIIALYREEVAADLGTEAADLTRVFESLREDRRVGRHPDLQRLEEIATEFPGLDTPLSRLEPWALAIGGETYATDMNPESLSIHTEELEFMDELGSILGSSPRSVKRFVNLYRLIKSGLHPQEQARFLEGESPGADFEVVLFLLAIVTGLPRASKPFFEMLRATDETPEPQDLATMLQTLSRATDLQGADELERLIVWTSKRRDSGWPELPVADLRPWARRVGRYSFRIERA